MKIDMKEWIDTKMDLNIEDYQKNPVILLDSFDVRGHPIGIASEVEVRDGVLYFAVEWFVKPIPEGEWSFGYITYEPGSGNLRSIALVPVAEDDNSRRVWKDADGIGDAVFIAIQILRDVHGAEGYERTLDKVARFVRVAQRVRNSGTYVSAKCDCAPCRVSTEFDEFIRNLKA